MNKKPIFIAEIKEKSPFGFKSSYTFNALMSLAVDKGDWVSIHTNPLWGGCFEAIEYVKKYTNKPILAKGIHSKDDDIKRALDYGADYVLVVDRIPKENITKCLLEFSDLFMLERCLDYYRSCNDLLKFVYNSRDLKTGNSKDISKQLYESVNSGLWTCQASGIKSPKDIYSDVNAFIVGENLVEYCSYIK